MRPALRTLVVLLFLTLPNVAEAAHERAHPPAPDFTLPTSSGTVSLHDLRGKVVFVDFWASWCAPCRESFPWMSTMFDQYSAQGLVIVSINLDKDRQAANTFIAQFTPQFAVAFDPAGTTAEAFHVAAMPSSFIVGRDGRIVLAHQGFEPAKARALEDQIKEALADGQKK